MNSRRKKPAGRSEPILTGTHTEVNGMKEKKLPLRMCTGCSEHKPKKELVRVVRSPEGEISLDLTGRKPGRGAYICPSLDCLRKARRAKRLERAFSCRIPDAVYDAMEKEMTDGEG